MAAVVWKTRTVSGRPVLALPAVISRSFAETMPSVMEYSSSPVGLPTA